MIDFKLSYITMYLVEAVIAAVYFNSVFLPRCSQAKERICISAGYALMFSCYFLDNILLNNILFFLINYAIIALCFCCKPRLAAMHAAFLTFAMNGSELVMKIFIDSFVGEINAYMVGESALISLVVTSKLLYFMIAMLASRFFKPKRHDANEPSLTAMLGVIPLASCVIAVSVTYICFSVKLSESVQILIAISIITLLGINVFTFVIYNILKKMNRDYISFQVSALRDQADAEYYTMLQSQYEDQRRLIHDMREHLGVINGFAIDDDCGKICDYIAKVEKLPALTSKRRMCDDPILNMLLQQYLGRCIEKGVTFTCDIRADTTSFLDTLDCTALFGNLLSNAFEAAGCSAERSIDLSISRLEGQNIVFLTIDNSCDIEPSTDSEGHFLTRKKESGIHGIGIKSIERIVKKYHGTLKMSYDSALNLFHCTIQIPVLYDCKAGQ